MGFGGMGFGGMWIEGTGIAGTGIAGTAPGGWKEQPGAQALFRALFHAGSQSRSHPLRTGREAGTTLLFNPLIPRGLEFLPWACILYCAASLRLSDPDSGNKPLPALLGRVFPVRLKGQPTVLGCSRATKLWMPSLSLLHARNPSWHRAGRWLLIPQPRHSPFLLPGINISC